MSTLNATAATGTVGLTSTDTEDCFALDIAINAQLSISALSTGCETGSSDPKVSIYDRDALSADASAAPIATVDDVLGSNYCAVGYVDIMGATTTKHLVLCVSDNNTGTLNVQFSFSVDELTISGSGAACDINNPFQRCPDNEECLVTSADRSAATTAVCGTREQVGTSELCNPGVWGKKECSATGEVCAQNQDTAYQCLPHGELCGFYAHTLMSGASGALSIEPRHATYLENMCGGGMSGGYEYWLAYVRGANNTTVTFSVMADAPVDAWALDGPAACQASTRTDCKSVDGTADVVVPSNGTTDPIGLVVKGPLFTGFSVMVTEQ